MVLALKFTLSPVLECCSNLIISSEIQEVVSVDRENSSSGEWDVLGDAMDSGLVVGRKENSMKQKWLGKPAE